MEIRRIVTQIAPDRVEEGYFTFDGVMLRQVNQDGRPAKTDFGTPIERVVRTDQDPEYVARMMIKENFSAFHGPIEYGSGGWR